jgi:hypothetical protein
MRTIDQHFDVPVSELTEWTPTRTKIHIPKDNTEELVSLPEQYIEIFATQVQREMRGIKFGVKADGKSHHKKFVYMEGYPYTMGYLHYGDPRENAEQKVNHFCVSAPTIMNEKYADYNSNYAMKMSVNLNQGVKNAKRYLQPVPWGVVAHKKFKDVRHAFNNVRNSFQDDFELSMSELGMNNKTLAPELANLIENGHVFLDKDLQDKVVDMVAKRKLYEEDKQKRCDLYFVYAYIKWGKETYIVIEIDDAQVISSPDWKTMQHTEYDADTLPEQLKGRVMSLNVLEQDTFVDGVGYKVGDNMFYVSR